jgi:hypothetical protein
MKKEGDDETEEMMKRGEIIKRGVMQKRGDEKGE